MGVTGCNSGLFTFKGLCHETDLSAVNDAAQENARFPRAHENARRSCGHSRSPRQGSRPPCRVSLGGSGKFPFSRAQRLDGPHAYAAVFAYKCCSSGRWFQVYVRPGGGSAARLGVVVSKRIMKTAVARNFYKRVARDVFRHARKDLGSLDFVIRPRAALGSADAPVARAELQGLLQKSFSLCHSRMAAAANR
jgi:ribonuclease P protein component